MLQQTQPKDYIIATGKSYTLSDFVRETSKIVGINLDNYLKQSQELFRPAEITISCADPSKAKSELDWSASIFMPEIVKRMFMDQID